MGYTEWGNLIKKYREQRNWDQENLAKTVGVTQQTVSRWEKGDSRPKRDMVVTLAQVLKIDLETLLAVADYKLSKPVQPLLQHLPLGDLNAEGFELFCLDFLLALNLGADVSRYGHQGDTQDGIDIFAKKGNCILDYQCKRHSQFGPADVTKAINDTTFEAEHHHLLLSRLATAAARKPIFHHDNWSLWDAEDISMKIRALPQDVALRIVRTHFPGWEKNFLGIDEPSPWLTPEEFFRPLANRVTLFSHYWSFVGRETELTTLNNFINTHSKAIIISGRGGIGKSRLLREFSQRQSDIIQIRFIPAGADWKPKDFQLLPTHGILVIDDAHESGDLDVLLKTIAIQRPEFRVIISTRPYGLTQIQYELMRAGYAEDTNESQVIELKDLSVDEAKSLAYEILKEIGGNIDLAEQIASVTKDCPLAIVVGSRLVASGQINPNLLNNSDDFRNSLLGTYRNIITGEIGDKDSEKVRELLDIIAVIQPIDPNDPTFEEVVTKILERNYNKILRNLTELENAGVLIRRRNKLRITPDLLADYIRAEAAYNIQNSRPTGFADMVFEAVRGGLQTNFVVNLSQLDWRLSANGVQTKLLDSVWVKLQNQFERADIYTQQIMLKALEKVAYYQPDKVLMFAEKVISECTDTNVIAYIPPILKYVGYNMEYLPRVLNWLRQLALDDVRATNQYPDHPLRIMTELAAIEPGKHIMFNEIILDNVLGWLDKPWTKYFSPFDIFDSLLATEGHQSEMKGITLTLRPYTVRAEAVEELRTKIITVAFETVKHRSLPKAIRAIKTIGEALRGPLGQGVTKEVKDQWLPTQLDVLHRLKILMEDPDLKLDPYIAVEVRDAISWHATFSKNETNDAAKAVLASIPTDLIHELTRALTDGWGYTFERGEDFRRDENRFTAWRIDVAQKLIKEYEGNFQGLINLLEERITVINSIDMNQSNDGGPFIGVIVSQSKKFGEILCRYILDHLGSPLIPFFGSALIALSKTDYNVALFFAEEGVSTGNDILLLYISWAVGYGFRSTIAINGKEADLIKTLIKIPSAIVRKNVVRSVERFDVSEKNNAIALILSMKYNDKKELADEVLQQFGKYGPFEVNDLTDMEIEDILTQLVTIDSIDDYNIINFFSTLSLSYPYHVLQFFKNRIEHKETSRNLLGYDPLPNQYRQKAPFRFSETAAYEHLLRDARDWSDENTDNWIRHHFGPKLFHLISGGGDEITLKVLDEWIASPASRHVEAAASLLSEVDRGFLWSHSTYIINLLERAHQHGGKCYTRVCSYLYAISYQGVRSGIPGQPFPEDLEQRDKAQVLINQLPMGSPAYDFYKSLYEVALSNIKRDTVDEEGIFDD